MIPSPLFLVSERCSLFYFLSLVAGIDQPFVSLYKEKLCKYLSRVRLELNHPFSSLHNETVMVFIYNCYTFPNVFESFIASCHAFKKIIYPATMLSCSYDETFHALLSCFFRSRYVLRSFLIINILSRNIILERILRTLAVRFQAPRLETIQVSDAIVGRTEKLESSIFACLCIASFS